MSAVDVLAVMDWAAEQVIVGAACASRANRIDTCRSLREARAAVAEALEAHAELLAWVERAIVPEYSERRPMPENCRKALTRSSNALVRCKGEQA